MHTVDHVVLAQFHALPSFQEDMKITLRGPALLLQDYGDTVFLFGFSLANCQ